MQDTTEIMKEAHIMQALAHKNIPTIIGVQLQKQPISFIMEFKGEDALAHNCHGKTKSHGTTNLTHGITKLTHGKTKSTHGKTKKTSWSAVVI